MQIQFSQFTCEKLIIAGFSNDGKHSWVRALRGDMKSLFYVTLYTVQGASGCAAAAASSIIFLFLFFF